jgi:predicted ATPase
VQATTTALVGRDADVVRLRELLAAERLVTVTGPGGVGKTRLALDGVAGGEWSVCELTDVDAAEDVPGAVAESLGFPSVDAAVVGVGDAERRLVLDNCEHMVSAAAEVAALLLRRCSRVRILATSREPLHVDGEHVFPLAPLDVPTGDDPDHVRDAPAVRLFVDRARTYGVTLTVDEQTAPALAVLARRLDGLPLAIELAAARAPAFTSAEIVEHLDARLDLLERRRAGGPPHHRSLAAAIAWSYERLPEETRRFFTRLGVFAGSFTADIAAAVAADPEEDRSAVLTHLDRLVAGSLITVDRRTERTWYRLLETLRDFSRDRLREQGELDLVQDRWVDAMVRVATNQVETVLRTWSLELYVAIHTLPGQLAQAIRWCLGHDSRPDRAHALFLPLFGILRSASGDFVADLGERLLRRWPDESAPNWAITAAITATAHISLGRFTTGAALAERALRAPDPGYAAVVARRALFLCDRASGHDDRALRWVEEGLAEAERLDIPPFHTELQGFHAVALAGVGRFDEALTAAAAAHHDAVRQDSRVLTMFTLLTRGSLLALRDDAAGTHLLVEATAMARVVGKPFWVGVGHRSTGLCALLAGRLDDAAEELRRALDVFAGSGDVPEMWVTIRSIAAYLVASGRDRAAATLASSAGAVPAIGGVDVLRRAASTRLPADLDATGPVLPLREAVALARRELAGPSPRAPLPANQFDRDGAVWTLGYAGTTVLLPDSKGLADIATLLRHPGREVHCTELAKVAVHEPDAGVVIDEQARRSYEKRITELQSELTEAEDAHDLGRAERVRVELDLLVDQLLAATGRGGRRRVQGGTDERARAAVGWRIRAAIKRIEQVHPELGRHLRTSLRTGAWCVYAPDAAVDWHVRA